MAKEPRATSPLPPAPWCMALTRTQSAPKRIAFAKRQHQTHTNMKWHIWRFNRETKQETLIASFDATAEQEMRLALDSLCYVASGTAKGNAYYQQNSYYLTTSEH